MKIIEQIDLAALFCLGKTKLICWSTGLTDPILSKKKKQKKTNKITKFWPTSFFLNLLISPFFFFFFF